MNYYFSKITADHWIAKNKLQEEAQVVAMLMERRLIPSDKVLDFKAEFIDKIVGLNKAFPRYNPLHLSITSDPIARGNKDIWFQIDGVFHLSLFWAKDEIDLNIVM